MSDDLAVIGAGAWGLALAAQAARAGTAALVWARDPARARDRAARLGLDVARLALTTRLDDLAAASLVLAVVPAQHAGAVLAALPGTAPIVSCAKGVEAATRRLPLEVLAAACPGRALGVLSGPNFAGEVAAGLPAAAVIAAEDPELRARTVAALASPTFRLYGSEDPLGVQLGGAGKNVIAIAAGAVTGAGLGENARAALITRGLAELGRLVTALGGRAETVAGLSGLGDLLLTATGGSSRNFSLGLALGHGQAPAVALAESRGVVEGAATARPLLDRAASAGVELPIMASVADLLEGRRDVAGAMADLLGRRLRDE